MRNLSGKLCFLVAAATLVFATACFDPFFYGTRAGGASVPDVVTYEGDVYPLLMSYCATCHSSGGAADTSAFVLSSDPDGDFANVTSFVAAGDPANTPLLQKASSASGHGGSAVLLESSVEFRTIASWVEQGAQRQ